MKKCPYCKEDVQDNALVCPHCKKNITTAGIISKLGCSLIIIGLSIPFLILGVMLLLSLFGKH
jgi:hypothetical protein